MKRCIFSLLFTDALSMGRVISTTSSVFACLATTFAVLFTQSIRGIVRVAFGTVSLGSFVGARQAATHVLNMCDQFEMCGPDASVHSTEVIPLQSGRRRSSKKVVSVTYSALHPEVPITSTLSPNPDSTAVRPTRIDVRPEGFLGIGVAILIRHREPLLSGVIGRAVSAAPPSYFTRKVVP